MNLVAIHSNRMMAYLVLRKFNLIKMEENKINKTRNVYLFHDSEELRNAMKKFKIDKDFHQMVEKLNIDYSIRKE